MRRAFAFPFGAFALGAVVLAGCSVIVEPASDVRCEPGDGFNPCPRGLVCTVPEGETIGTCREPACTPPGAPDSCNGSDDDCDGVIDEETAGITEVCNGSDDDCDGLVDEGNDADADGYNTCGTQGCDADCTPNPDLADCNDAPDDPAAPSINPGAPEQCNFVDHDCDGSAVPEDLGPLDAECAEIAPGTICNPSRGCVPADCRSERPEYQCMGDEICDTTASPPRCVLAGCTPTECAAAGQWCDPAAGECRPRLGNGVACEVDEQCQSLVCLEPGALRLPASVGSRICVSTCCTDSDCPSGEFCWDAGNGARSCLPEGFAFEVTGRSTLGSAPAGASCSSGSECRSGFCQDDQCFSPCRANEDCPDSLACSLDVRDGPDGLRVVTACASGRRSEPQSCDSSLDCTGLCCDVVRFGAVVEVRCDRDDSFIDNECVDFTWCRTDSDCGGDGCSYIGASDSGVVAVCQDPSEGQPCCNNRQCPDGVCRPQLGASGGESWLMLCAEAPTGT